MLHKKSTRVGSEAQYGPRLAGEILHNYLKNSIEPFAAAYRDRLFKDFFPDTHLDVDLKLMIREPGRMSVGTYLDGVITHDSEEHFTFVQNALVNKVVSTKRNPHVYRGMRININRKDDGTLYPTFNRPQYTESFCLRDFCREAANELIAVMGLVESV
jgi:hypothetical protein